MKLQSTLLAALLGLTAQAFAGANPLQNAAIEQDIQSMQLLGAQYRITGKAVESAWERLATAQRQGNPVVAAVATEQLAFYRFTLSKTTEDLVAAKAKLTADLKSAPLSSRLDVYAETGPQTSRLTRPGFLGLF